MPIIPDQGKKVLRDRSVNQRLSKVMPNLIQKDNYLGLLVYRL
jgi:hypothetical protein